MPSPATGYLPSEFLTSINSATRCVVKPRKRTSHQNRSMRQTGMPKVFVYIAPFAGLLVADSDCNQTVGDSEVVLQPTKEAVAAKTSIVAILRNGVPRPDTRIDG